MSESRGRIAITGANGFVGRAVSRALLARDIAAAGLGGAARRASRASTHACSTRSTRLRPTCSPAATRSSISPRACT